MRIDHRPGADDTREVIVSIFNDPRFQTLSDEEYEKHLEKANEEVSMMFDNVHIPFPKNSIMTRISILYR